MILLFLRQEHNALKLYDICIIYFVKVNRNSLNKEHSEVEVFISLFRKKHLVSSQKRLLFKKLIQCQDYCNVLKYWDT